MSDDARGWLPGSFVELWGGSVVFHSEDAFEQHVPEATVMGPEDVLAIVLSSVILRPDAAGNRGFVFVLVGQRVGWVNSLSIRRTWDGKLQCKAGRTRGKVVAW